MLVYTVLWALMTLLLIIKRKYKNNIRSSLDKKEHSLKMIYGPAMFVLDHLPRGIIEKNTKVNNKVKHLSVRENVKEKIYLYNVKKLSLGLVIIYLGLIVGMICSVSQNKGTIIKTIQRGKTSIMYAFSAKDEKGHVENVNIQVDSRNKTKKEKRKIIKDAYKKLKKKALGKNKSWNHINQPLNLVTQVGKVKVVWEISDSKVVGYDGVINPKVKKEIVDFRATLELEKVREEYCFAGNIYSPKAINNLDDKLQAYVNDNNKTKKSIKLPERINGHNYVFFQEVTNYGKFVLPVCLALAVFVFVAKDKDLDKEVEERNNQMIRDYPEIVSKLLIYLGAGLSFKSSIERIVTEYKRTQGSNKSLFKYAYEELDVALGRMKNGVSESKAIAEFGKNCNVHCYIKLANILEQNIKRGTREMVFALKSEVSNALSERKNNALKAGSEISTKLLGPMVVMLVIAIVIIMAPALLSMNL